MTDTHHRAMLNRYALGTALALVTAQLAGVESAEAACTPATSIASPVSGNPNVSCTGNVLNQNTTAGGLQVGWGTATESGNTITVQSGASVAGTSLGIAVDSSNTITVQSGASVTGGATGVSGNINTTLHNSGSILGDTAFKAQNQLDLGVTTVDNDGGISGNVIGLQVSGGTLSVTGNTGMISGGNFGISAGVDMTITNNVTGVIQATGANGVAIGTAGAATFTNTVTLDNAGSITANASGGIAIEAQNVNVNSNTGTINGGGFGIKAAGTVTVNNANAISATDVGSSAIKAGTSNVTNTGLIQALAFGINATGTATVKNGGSIEAMGANGIAIGDSAGAPANVVTVDNSGKIEAFNTGGIAIRGLTVNVNSNTNFIGGDTFGINATGTATVKNGVGGVISAAAANGIAIGDNATQPSNMVTLDNSGTVKAIGTGGIAIQALTVNVNSNTGDITGDKRAIFANDTANVTNSKNITANAGDGDAIRAQTANVTNLAGGVITGGDNGGRGIAATGDLVLNNAGKITGNFAVSGNDSAAITNSGQLTGGGGIDAGNLTLTNSGSITATSFEAASVSGDANIVNLAGGTIQGKTFGISTNTLTLVNSGMISGQTAIGASGAAVITNFGTIQSTAGATGTAIQLSSAADTLNIKRGSSIIGLIDFGHGADVINVDSTAPQTPKGVSMLSRATSAVVDALKQQLVNFDGIINIIGGNSNTSGQPTVTVNGTTASLDPTALAQQDRTLMDFTGGMSSMVQGRLGGGGGGAGGAGPQAMSYAMEDARAEIFSKAPAATWNAPVNVWTSAFGGVRSQNGTDTTLDSRSSVAGGAIGVDRRIRPDWLVGLFAGGGSGVLNVDLGSQKVDTDYFSGGAYSRFEWASQFVDTTLQVGGVNNRSDRLMQNNITGGQEHATASYNGWFISPEIAYGYHVNLGNGAVVTPVARVRYVAGFFDGYNETGSVQTLSIGSRTLQDFEERAELEFAKTGFAGDPNLKLTMHGGVIAWQRTGNATINALLIGQNLSFVTPGRSSAVGGIIGAGLDYHVGANVALFGAVEGTLMSDESQVVSAKGGMRVAF